MKNIRLVISITILSFTLAVTTGLGQTIDLEQRISFVVNDKTIPEVLNKITELSHIRFSYSKEEMPSTKFDLSINNETFSSVLNKLSTIAKLEFRQLGNMIAIRKVKQLSVSDSYLSISGTVVAAENNEPLVFATIGVVGRSKGTITNTSGSFALTLPENFKSDTLFISMVGYQTVRMIVDGDAADINIKMKSQPVILNEIEVTEKKIKAEDIFREIKSRLKFNYPTTDYAMECFYREIKTENGTHRSLLEAALVIHDKGYDHSKSEESGYIREVRGSSKFINRFSDFWQENNLLKATLGLNAVRHPSSIPNVFGKDTYQLKGTSMLNEKEVYVLVSDIMKNDCWQRTLYVDVETYAIYRSEEIITNFEPSWRVGNSDSIYLRLTKGTSILDFKPYKGKLYLNHIRHDVENEYFNPLTNKILDRFTIINDVLVNDIYENSYTATEGLKKMENYALELQVTPYNGEFWEHYNFIKQTPLEAEVMKDLAKKRTLKDQFVESGTNSQKPNSKKKKH